ncbi:MAG: hypothetical protein OEY93_07980 [Anaerolineae bacterium]|nr:hypothetical protein [Anaerolineae bacterium]
MAVGLAKGGVAVGIGDCPGGVGEGTRAALPILQIVAGHGTAGLGEHSAVPQRVAGQGCPATIAFQNHIAKQGEFVPQVVTGLAVGQLLYAASIGIIAINVGAAVGQSGPG